MLDASLVDREGRMVVHAYSAGNEDYEQWASFTKVSMVGVAINT